MRRVPGYSLWLGHAGDVRDLRCLLTTGIIAVVDLAIQEAPAPLTRELVYCRFPLVDGPGNPPWLLSAAIETVAGLLRNDVSTLVGRGKASEPFAALPGAPSPGSGVVRPARAWPSRSDRRRPTSRRDSGATSV